MCELHPGPGIEEILADTGDADRAISQEFMAHRVLHESIRDQNEIAGNPASHSNSYRRQKVQAWAEAFLAPDQCANEGAFEKERKHPLHRERLSDDAARVFGKTRPIRAELKFHRNPRDNPNGKIQSEDFCPE